MAPLPAVPDARNAHCFHRVLSKPSSPPAKCAVCNDEVLAQSHKIEVPKRIFIIYNSHTTALSIECPCVLLGPTNVIAENEDPEATMSCCQIADSRTIVCNIADAVKVRGGLR